MCVFRYVGEHIPQADDYMVSGTRGACETISSASGPVPPCPWPCSGLVSSVHFLHWKLWSPLAGSLARAAPRDCPQKLKDQQGRAQVGATEPLRRFF